MLYIVRHGETELNSRHVLQGRSDEPLNENGVHQAETAGEWFRSRGISFETVWASPLQRAVRTAEIIAPGVPVRIDQRLIEMDYGPYEGMDLKHPAPEVMRFFRDFVHQPAPEGMEPLQKIVQRAGAFVEECCRSGENILISTHAIAMKGILEYLTPESGGSYWSTFVGNCGVYAAEWKDGRFEVPKELYRGSAKH